MLVIDVFVISLYFVAAPFKVGTQTTSQSGLAWTKWYSADFPSGNGDYEDIVRHGQVCGDERLPIDIECRTVGTHLDHSETNFVFLCPHKCTTRFEFACINSEQSTRCDNFEVRYLCDNDTGSHPPSKGIVQGIGPLHGPLAGNTTVTVHGLDFITNQPRRVYFGKYGQTIESIYKSHFTITTKPADKILVEEALPVKVDFINDICTLELTDFNFTYKNNPEILDIHPENHFYTGGTVATVTGRYLDSVAQPKMTITQVYKYYNQSKPTTETTVFTSNCTATSGETMYCPMPVITVPENFLVTKRTTRSTDHCQQIKQKHNNDTLDYYFGFLFDGFRYYENLTETNVKKRPALFDAPKFLAADITFRPEYEEIIVIRARNIHCAASIDDFKVALGTSAFCRVKDVLSNGLYCAPPKEEPDDNQKAGHCLNMPIWVTVGYSEHYAGCLSYHTSSGLCVYTIAAGCGAAFLLLVVIVTAISCWKARSNTQNNIQT